VSPGPTISTSADDEEILRRFAQHLGEKFPNWSLASVICYENDVRSFAAFLRAKGQPAKGLAHSSELDAGNYFTTLKTSKLKPDTIRRRATALRHFFQFLPQPTAQTSFSPKSFSAHKQHNNERLRALGKSGNAIHHSVYEFIRSWESASPHTIKAYTSDLLKFLLFLEGESNWQRIDGDRIRAFLAQLHHHSLSSKSVARALATVKSFFAWLKRRHRIEVNPTLGLSVFCANLVPDVPEHEVIRSALQQCLAVFPERARLIWELLHSCGITTSELVSIDLEHIDWYNTRILVRGKHRRERYVHLNEECLAALRTYLLVRASFTETGPDSPLVINLRGNRISSRSIGRIVKTVATASGLPSSVHPHTLRHAFRVHELAQGTNVHLVRHALGITGHSPASAWRVR
jgi:integrase/recombinase XerC